MADSRLVGKLQVNQRRASRITEELVQTGVQVDKSEHKYATAYTPPAVRWASVIQRVKTQSQTRDNIEGLDLSSESLRIGVPYAFEVRCEGMGRGKLEMSCTPKEAAKLKVKSPESLVYVCTIVPKLLGVHEIAIEYKGRHVFGSPFQVTFRPPADASKCRMVETPSECTSNLPQSDILYCFSTRGAGEGVLSASIKVASSRKQYLPVDISLGSMEDHYHVQFTPTDKSQYILSVLYDRQHISGSPFTIALSDASKCRAEGSGLNAAIAGQESVFQVNTLHAGPGTLTVEIEGEDGRIEPDIALRQDVLYEVRYTADKPGTYTVSLLYDSMPISGSPYTVTCLEPPDASKCVVYGPYLPTSLGKAVEMRVDTRNAGSGELTAIAAGDMTGSGDVRIEKFEDQFYNLIFSPQAHDVYSLAINWGTQPIPGSPFRLDLSPPKPSEVTVAEPPASTVKAGLPIKICFDCSKAGLGEFTASCRGRKVGEIPIDIAKRPDTALYDVETVPPDEDIYSITVKWAGRDIKGSPFSINLIPIDVTKIRCKGPLQPCGREGSIEFTMCTEGAGLGKVTARAIGSRTGSVPVAVKRESEVSYKLSFQPPNPDIYTFNVTYGSERVPGSPYYINTNPVDPSEVRVSAEPPSPELYRPLVYKCNTIDAGSGEITASCCGSQCGQVELELSKHGIAQVNVTYTPTCPDIYSTSILWAGEHVPGSPFMTNLLPVDITKVQIGELQVPKTAGGGDECGVEIDCSHTGPGEVKAECKGERLGKVPVDSVTQDNLKFKVKFKPKEADVYHLSVLFTNQHLPGSPFTINLLPPQPEAVKHIATWVPDDDNLRDLTSIAFDVSRAGNGRLSVTASGLEVGPVLTEIEETAPGQVSVLLSLSAPDIYTVHVLWAGEEVPDSPFIIDTKPPDMTKIKTQGPCFLPTSGEVKLNLLAQDAGRGKVKATVIGSLTGHVPVSITDTAVDCYKLVFHPPQHDVYTFGVWYGREQVPDSPFYVNTHPPDAGRVKVAAPESLQCQKLEEYRCDASEAGSGSLAAECVGEETGKVALTINKHGVAKYHVSLTFSSPDIYSLSITWAGEHVRGSPFRINLLPVDVGRVKVGELHAPEKAGIDEHVWLDLDCSCTGVGEVQADCCGKSVGQTPVVVNPLRSDNYQISFRPEVDDLYTLSVSYGGTPITGSPFTVNLIPPNPRMVKLLRMSLPNVLAKDPIVLLLDASQAGRGTLHAKGSSHSDSYIPVDVKHFNLSEGLFELHCTPLKPEVYRIVVFWSDQPIADSPLTIDLRKPENVRCTGPSYTRAGAVASLSVDTSEAGPGQITATCVGEKCGHIPVELSLNSPTVHSVTIHPLREDIYKLSVYYDDTEVPGSPFFIDLHPHTPVDEKMTVNVLYCQEEAIQLPQEIQELAMAAEELEVTQANSQCELTSYIGDPTVLTVVCSEACASELTATAVGDTLGAENIRIVSNADETFDVLFDPELPDRYTITVSLNDQEIPGSPFIVNYVMPVDHSKCRVFGLEDHPDVSAVYQRIQFGVDVSTAGHSKLQVFLIGPSDTGYPPKFTTTVEKSVYRIAYLPTASGVHYLHLLWGGQSIPGSPLVFKVGTATAVQCHKYGKPIAMQVHYSSEPEEMTVHAIHQESGKIHTVDVSKVREGRRELKIRVDEPGVYAVHLFVRVKEIPGSPYFTKYAKPTNPAAVEVRDFSSTGSVGEPLQFMVDTREAGVGDLKVRASGLGLRRRDFAVEDNKDGTYSAVLTPNSPGEYQFHILWSGQPITGSPLRADVISKKPTAVERLLPQLRTDESKVVIHPEDQKIFGQGLPFEEPACFRILVAKAGPGQLNIVTQGPGKATVRLDDKHDGTYVCVLTPSLPGKYLTSVLWNDKHIPGSPYTIRFSGNQKSYMVEGLHLDRHSYLIGVPHTFRVQCGSGTLNIVCKPSYAALINIRPVSQLLYTSGAYKCEILPVQVGSHKISVLYNDQHILGSPFEVIFELPASASKCRILSKSIEPTDQWGVFRAVFHVSTPSAGEELSATAEDAATRERVSISVTETSKGRYRLQATIREEREYLVSVKYGQQHIQDSPFRLDFYGQYEQNDVPKRFSRYAEMSYGEDEPDSGPVRPNRVRAYGPGLENSYIGQEGNFTVETAEGGAGTLAVRVHGPKGAFKINMRRHPDSDRTILVRYDPTHVGQYTVDITWSDVHIPGSPFKVDVLDQGLRTIPSEDDLDWDQLMPSHV